MKTDRFQSVGRTPLLHTWLQSFNMMFTPSSTHSWINSIGMSSQRGDFLQAIDFRAHSTSDLRISDSLSLNWRLHWSVMLGYRGYSCWVYCIHLSWTSFSSVRTFPLWSFTVPRLGLNSPLRLLTVANTSALLPDLLFSSNCGHCWKKNVQDMCD